MATAANSEDENVGGEAVLPPWERLPDEPAKWYERFDVFRLLGPARTLEEAGRREAKGSKGQRPPRVWYPASKRWKWRERAEAWDAVERVRHRAVLLKELNEARQRHLHISRLFQAKAVERINALTAADLTPAEARAYFNDGVRAEIAALTVPLIEELESTMKSLEEEHRGELRGEFPT